MKPLTSKQVAAFMPVDAWTKVILLSSSLTGNIYTVTTEDKMKKRLQDMEKISLMSEHFERVEEFEPFNLVAVKIDDHWYRAVLLGYNEYKSNDTIIELIDIGSIHETKLQNLFKLPIMLYDPLSLAIKFKNFTPKTKEFTIRPLLSESNLCDGAVTVDVKSDMNLDQTQNEKQLLEVNQDSLLSKRSLKSTQSETKKNVLKNGDYCLITVFKDFNCLYVCKAFKKDENDYDVLDIDLVLKTASSTDEITLKNPVVGDTVKVFSTESDGLFRAKILRKNNDGSYDVYFIDYGNTETVQSNVIYELADELNKPGLAVKVGMNDLNNMQCTNEIKKLFEEFVNNGTPFIIEFNEESENTMENVKLKDAENGYYINSSFIMKYLPKKSNLEADIQIYKNTLLVNGYNYDNQVKNLKNNDRVYLTHFEDIANVFIVKDVKLLNEVIKSTVQDEPHVRKTDFNEGDIIKVVLKNCIYRAEIKEINTASIGVINIDIGCWESIKPDFVYELSDDLKKIPGLAIKVGIKRPLLNNSPSLTKFIDDLKTVPLCLKFDEKNLNKYQNVTLHRADSCQNIFEEFLKTLASKLSDAAISDGNKNEKKELIYATKPCLIDDFQNIQLENGDYCFVSYFKDFKNIYVSKAVKDCSDNTYKLHNLSIILETLQSKDRKTLNNPAIGDFVKVLSPSFKDFYRAEIKNVINTDFHVSYIDYGNTEVVQLSDIFELSNELKKENKLPIKVSVEVPLNAKVNDEIEMLFTNLIENNVVLSIEFKEKSKNGLENVILKEVESGNTVNNNILKLLPIQKPIIKNADSCYLRHFENFDSIYVSKVEDSQVLIDTIKSTDRKTKTDAAIGDIIKVLSPSFEGFYRAEIIKKIENTKYLVFYIDFGNTEVVQSNNLFELSDYLNKKPGTAIKIGINMPHNVEPNDEIKKMFSDLADNEELIIIEFDESSEIGLTNCTMKVKSSDILINNKVTELLPDCSFISDKANDSEMKNEENFKSPDVKSNQIKPKLLKNGELVSYRYFHNSNSVFVGQGSEEHQEQFLSVTEKTMNDLSKINKSNVEIGDIVKAEFDGIMYRAKILKKVNEDRYCISFIDFGNQETVHVDEIFELPDDLKQIPELSIEIGIKGLPIIDETKKKIITGSLEELELMPLYIEYDENIPNGLKEATLRYKANNLSVFDDIFKNNNILSINDSLEKLPITPEQTKKEVVLINSFEPEIMSSIQLRNGDVVFCCNFEDFNHIYLCKSSKNNKPENDKLIIDSSEIKDIVVKQSPIKYGDIIRVIFERKVFRAQVIDEKSKETYTVFLMDSGKIIDVCADNIFEIPEDLKMIPGLAQKVGLKKSIDIKITKIVRDYFHGLWYNNPVPLVLTYDESVLNYLNEVNLKKQSDGYDIVEDLLKLCELLNNAPDEPIINHSTSNGSNVYSKSVKCGDYVEFLFGNNIDNIYVRHSRVYNDFKHILEKLKEFKPENLVSINPKPNDYVAVCSRKYNGCYRAKVFGPSDDDTTKFKCSLIDYGYIDYIPSKYIFELPNDFTKSKVPTNLVYRVTLSGLTKITNNNKLHSYLKSLTGKQYILEFDKNADRWFKQVVLKDIKSEKTLNQEIKELETTVLPPTSQQKRLERKTISPVKEENEVKKPLHPIKSGTSVFITHFENFNCIFVRDTSFDFIAKFNDLNRQMLKYYRKSTANTKEINIGDKVCVKSMINMCIYSRALVIDKIGEDFKVFYLDYGNTEFVHIDDIHELPNEFEKLPEFVIKVQLKNMTPIPTDDKALQSIREYFKNTFTLLNTKLIVEFNDFNINGLDEVTFKTEFYEKDICDTLRDMVKLLPLNTKNTGPQQNSGPSSNKLPYMLRRQNSMIK